MHLSISDHYFGFGSLVHARECRLSGTNMWETTVHRTDYGPLPRNDHETRRDGYQVVVRMVCRACGVVHIETGESYSRECTDLQAIGYAASPRGRPVSGCTPARRSASVTITARRHTTSPAAGTTRPPARTSSAPSDGRPARAGGRVWWAAYGLRERKLSTGSFRASGYVDRQADTGFRSRAGVAKWVAAQRPKAHAAMEARA